MTDPAFLTEVSALELDDRHADGRTGSDDCDDDERHGDSPESWALARFGFLETPSPVGDRNPQGVEN